jgi:hypothetical protein
VEKGIPLNLGSQFTTLKANVPAFINIVTFIHKLGAKQQAKNAQSWPMF